MTTLEGDPALGLHSVDRALRILELLGERRAVRVMDVADHLGVARSTAHRLLTALHRRGFVVQDAARQYHRGPALSAPVGGPGLRFLVRPHLERLRGITGEPCHLVKLEGNGARILDVVGAQPASRPVHRAGILLPAHTTAAGTALLAELFGSDLIALYPAGLPRTASGDSLRGDLASARRRGYAVGHEPSGRTITSIGIAVKDACGLAAGSIGISLVRTPRGQLGALVQMLRETAADAEAAIGGRSVATSQSVLPG
ncbi:IclR family transcriptional regulator [Streptomyces mirabilis]